AAVDEGLASGYLLTTATSDWTTYDTIGGLTQAAYGALQFSEGHFLTAIRNHQWLVIDELNRSNFDRAFGQLFTVLAGQPVVLPFKRAGQSKPLSIVPYGVEAPHDTDVIRVTHRWRIVETLYVFVQNLLVMM